MIIVDAHCDTITKIMEDGQRLNKNSCHIDLERMRNYDGYIQFFAAFVNDRYGVYSMKRAVEIIDEFYKQIEANSECVVFCKTCDGIEKALKSGKLAALLSIENGSVLLGELSALRIFYRLGVRSLCLTWNGRNEIADGAGGRVTGGGLTPFGRDVVSEMNNLGMLIDVSHMAEKGFWDVLELTRTTVVASHSNAQKICQHPRNLSDEQLLALKNIGGVAGINFYPYFLNGTAEASLTDIIRHIDYIEALLGPDNVGIGADFDGIEVVPAGIKGIQDLQLVFEELARLNYSQEQIDKLAGKNFLRVLEGVLK